MSEDKNYIVKNLPWSCFLSYDIETCTGEVGVGAVGGGKD